MLTDLVEARRLASQAMAAFSRSNEAANRAVMAEDAQSSKAAADEARQASRQVQQTIDELQPRLQSLGYTDEQAVVHAFLERFRELTALDREILPLAAENTNLEAQRLSFGEGQQAASAFAAAVKDAAGKAPAPAAAERAAAAATLAIAQVQVIQARHIAEAHDDAMAAMEAEMAERQRTARAELARLRSGVPAGASPALAAAQTALDRFGQVNDRIITLSRRNSNVRSLALTLGRKRVVAAECVDQLRLLEEKLAGHTLKATR